MSGYDISDQMATDSQYIERLFREDLAREQARQDMLKGAAIRALLPLETGEFNP